MRQKILDHLLDKYEKSTAYRKQAAQNRRIQIKCQKLSWVDMENHEEKESFHEAVVSLTKAGITDYAWVRREECNLMDSVWLRQDSDAIAEAYRLAGRSAKLDRHAQLVESIREVTFFYYPWMNILKADLLADYDKRHDVSNKLYRDMGISDSMIRLLLHLEMLQGREVHERVLSAALFGDSKYFMMNLKKRLHKLIERYDIEEKTDQDLVERVGIITNPEMILFCGPAILYFDGKPLDFSILAAGAAVPGASAEQLERIELSGVEQVIFIENSAVYDGFIKKLPSATLAVYHGGFAGHAKRCFFSRLFSDNVSVTFRHWSDIDLGGFRIFSALKQIVPTVEPILMDISTLELHQAQWTHFNDDYAKRLEYLLDNPIYDVFRDTIVWMLDHCCRLEQEHVDYFASFDEKKS